MNLLYALLSPCSQLFSGSAAHRQNQHESYVSTYETPAVTCTSLLTYYTLGSSLFLFFFKGRLVAFGYSYWLLPTAVITSYLTKSTAKPTAKRPRPSFVHPSLRQYRGSGSELPVLSLSPLCACPYAYAHIKLGIPAFRIPSVLFLRNSTSSLHFLISPYPLTPSRFEASLFPFFFP